MISTTQKILPISIIIPTRNEAPNIAATVERAQIGSVCEIIVVDCGSADGTQEIAQRHGAQVILSEPGRARQMNAGAAVSQGETLLFLHADTLLPVDFATRIPAILRQDNVVAGAFSLAIDLPGPAARVVAMMANFRSRALHMPYGDQGLFLTRHDFYAVGGYPEEPILEDLLIVRRLRRRGHVNIARSPVMTSGRRWRELGIIRTTLINQAIILGYLAGVPTQRLQSWYRIAKKI